MIAIKDMSMPRNCYECWFEDANRCYLNILQHIESLDRPEWCPLVEITEPRWIPCSERLPEYITQVLVQLTRTGDIFVGALAPNVEGTYTMWDLPNFSSYICLEDVIAWMPLPKPYKMGEVEE